MLFLSTTSLLPVVSELAAICVNTLCSKIHQRCLRGKCLDLDRIFRVYVYEELRILLT